LWSYYLEFQSESNVMKIAPLHRCDNVTSTRLHTCYFIICGHERCAYSNHAVTLKLDQAAAFSIFIWFIQCKGEKYRESISIYDESLKNVKYCFHFLKIAKLKFKLLQKWFLWCKYSLDSSNLARFLSNIEQTWVPYGQIVMPSMGSVVWKLKKFFSKCVRASSDDSNLVSLHKLTWPAELLAGGVQILPNLQPSSHR